MTNKSLVVLGLFLFVVHSVAGSKVLIDIDPKAELSGSDICRNSDKRISRLSSIGKLINQFESPTCRDQWQGPLDDLQKVLDKVQVDACGQEAVDEIHNFHWNYVVGTLSKSWRKASKAPLPDPLRVFFMNLADDIAERCKSKLADRLREAATDQSISRSLMGFKLDLVSIAMVTAENVKKYDDFFLVLESLLAAQRKKGKSIAEVYDPITGEVVSMSVKLRNATKPYAIQQQCRHHLRPVYANTVLPVMKLIDMGYGKLGDRVGNDELLKNWYSMTQLCQLILPVRFYTSSSLKSDQVSLVSEEEAKTLQTPADAVPKEQLPVLRRVTPVRVEDVLAKAANDKIVKQVKSNFKTRGRIYRRTFKNVLWTLKSQMKSVIKSIFVAKKRGDKFALELDDDSITATLNKAHEELEEDELNDLGHSDGMGILVRRKRGSDPAGMAPILIFILVVVLLLFAVMCILKCVG